MTTESPVIVHVTRRLQATPERVFDAWLTPEQAGKFLFATATGQMVRVEIDARVGGSFTFVDRRDGQDIEHIGEYLEIDRPRRLVFFFAVAPHTQDLTRVEITITPTDTGCEVVLAHTLHLDWGHFAEKAKAGWATILDGLAASLG